MVRRDTLVFWCIAPTHQPYLHSGAPNVYQYQLFLDGFSNLESFSKCRRAFSAKSKQASASAVYEYLIVSSASVFFHRMLAACIPYTTGCLVCTYSGCIIHVDEPLTLRSVGGKAEGGV